MAVVVKCTNCGKALRVADELQGKKARCPGCSTVFVIPAAAAVVAERPAAPPPPAAPVTREPAAKRPAPPRRDEDDEDDEYPDEGGRERGRRFAPLKFNVMVTKDEDKELKGAYQGEWTAKGLRLVKRKKTALLISPGAESEYVKGNRISVDVEGRRVELAVGGPQHYQHRLAKDVVAFLNGDEDEPDPRGYTIPWYLFIPAVLPIGIPIITLGGALPMALGFGLCGACLGIARLENLHPGVRIGLSLFVSLVGYAILVALVIGIGLVTAFR